jgi:hypothetical protein
MMIVDLPEVELAPPPLETKPRRSNDWLTRLFPRVKLGFEGEKDPLWLENQTDVPWRVYHNYHLLGFIYPQEIQVFYLAKHGNFSVRPYNQDDVVEYLVVSLTHQIEKLLIYHKRMARELEVYEMKIVG